MEEASAIFDADRIGQIIFHPRVEPEGYSPIARPTQTQAAGATIAGYLHPSDASDALCILFHGNGEIAADYDFLAPMYADCGVSCWIVDYRGYGRSTGTPTFSKMLADAEAIYADIPRLEATIQREFKQIIVMGRSLGSASALHLAAIHGSSLAGLVLDSPYADGPALVARLSGIPFSRQDFPDFEDNLDKIRQCQLPVFIVHGTEDRIIPITEAEALFAACPSATKQLLKIPGAGHNDMLAVAFQDYYTGLKSYFATLM